MHHFKAKGGTKFNFNSEMSGDVQILKKGRLLSYVDCFDLLEFARWYVGTVEIRGPSDPTKLGEVLYELLREAATRQAPVSSELDALRERDKFSATDCSRCGKRLAAGGYCTIVCGLREHQEALDAECGTDTPVPTQRPARDVAHDILEQSGWHPSLRMGTNEAADAIVAIIRADREGGQ